MAISGSVLQLRSDRFLRSGDGESRISLRSSGLLATCSELHGASRARVRRLCVGAPAVHWPNLAHTSSNTATKAMMAK
jgi:hypothetical protein